MQRCPQCEQELPETDYSPSQRGRPGTWCKGCRRAYNKTLRPAAPPRDCETCHKPIPNARHHQRFCSPACKMKALRERRAKGEPPVVYRSQKTQRAGKQFEAECTRCGERFWYTYVRKARTVCDLCRRHDMDWSTFRLSGAAAEELRRAGQCEICGTREPGGRYGNWHIDHDHQTGAIRGVLCSYCNTALGLMGDDPARLEAAARYLRTHERTANVRPR